MLYKDIIIIQNNIKYDFSDIYQVNKDGDVYNKLTNNVLNKQYDSHGYVRYHFWIRGKNKHLWFYAHRLVANAFIPNPNDLPQVNHKDGNKNNNNVNNLEWCTQGYNMSHGFKTGLFDNAIKHSKSKDNINRLKENAKNLKVKVDKYDMNGNFIQTYNSYKEAANDVKLKFDTSIRRCCKGELKSAAGYIWKKH